MQWCMKNIIYQKTFSFQSQLCECIVHVWNIEPLLMKLASDSLWQFSWPFWMTNTLVDSQWRFISSEKFFIKPLSETAFILFTSACSCCKYAQLWRSSTCEISQKNFLQFEYFFVGKSVTKSSEKIASPPFADRQPVCHLCATPAQQQDGLPVFELWSVWFMGDFLAKYVSNNLWKTNQWFAIKLKKDISSCLQASSVPRLPVF